LNKYILISIIFFSLISCSRFEVQCDGQSEIQTVKEIYKRELLKDKFSFRILGMENIEEYIDEFLKSNVKFDLIRTKSIDKELKSCECVANVNFVLPDEYTTYYNEKLKKMNAIERMVLTNVLIPESVDVSYNLQETNDEEFIAEAYLINEELKQAITSYYMLEKSYNENYNNIKEQKEKEKILTRQKELIKKYSLNEILKNDLKTLKISEIPKIWSFRYDLLPDKNKNTIFSGKESYKLEKNKNDVESLIRGFSWYCENNTEMNNLGEYISTEIGYEDINITYKAGMVYFYYTNQFAVCE
jgi:hypothetical protein